ncbi:hypothetical protein XpruCFBP8354_19440 [Xanthomonas prunicola]|uniref:Uncharacterized protein n=1 Tax=Xanthomonas prunicola TaxID=2053930 RepID=A0A2N3RFS4_9XANT|nr:hypothetical protein XpruCFBP8353_19050 [Xanthomonas prunicola]PKV15557.1 hypothetical protein XpruCFBP8354_19440 [Xanthomonas prunicola]
MRRFAVTVCGHGDLRGASPHATDGDGRSAGASACVGIIISALDQRRYSRRSAVALRQQPINNRMYHA